MEDNTPRTVIKEIQAKGMESNIPRRKKSSSKENPSEVTTASAIRGFLKQDESTNSSDKSKESAKAAAATPAGGTGLNLKEVNRSQRLAKSKPSTSTAPAKRRVSYFESFLIILNMFLSIMIVLSTILVAFLVFDVRNMRALSFMDDSSIFSKNL
jgi:hypothetical protein